MAMIDAPMLDRLRGEGDPLADALSAHYLDRPPTDLLHAAFSTGFHDRDAADPHVARWLAERPALPEWADQARLRNGAAFFAQWGVELGLGLFLASLPLAYAAHDGAQVLALTARLETDAKRRVLESAQFVLDVTGPGQLEPGRHAYDTARHVRLVHAGVRHLIEHDTRISRSCDGSVPPPRWCEDWGVPINQEHLLGAMISFSSSLLGVLDTLGITYDAQGAADYLHLWNVVGHLLGLHAHLLPLERTELDALEALIRQRNERASEAGRLLTDALITLVQSFVPMRVLRGVPVSTMRLLIGDPTADLLGVPSPDWSRHLHGTLRRVMHRLSLDEVHDRLLRAMVGRLSRATLTGFVDAERGGDRPAFTIPTHLAGVWHRA